MLNAAEMGGDAEIRCSACENSNLLVVIQTMKVFVHVGYSRGVVGFFAGFSGLFYFSPLHFFLYLHIHLLKFIHFTHK